MADLSDSTPALAAHESIAAAISALLFPHAEVVLHDLATNRVAGIWNAWSGRAVGSASHLDPAERFGAGDAVLGPYEKTSADGRRLKSVTAVLRDAQAQAIGLLCINLDVSLLDTAMRLLAAFVTPPQPRPAALFSKDWREQINFALHQWLQQQGLALAALTRRDRIALVAALDTQGLFDTRNAAEHVAELMGSSRASVYTYLAESRRQFPQEPH